MSLKECLVLVRKQKNVMYSQKMTCQCKNCQTYINTIHTDPWIVYMQNMIRTGKVIHIGFDHMNRPLFRYIN